MNTAQTISEIILQTIDNLKKNGASISVNKMLIDCGINQSLLRDMKVKGQMPSADKLAKIASYLNISTDYLLGNTNDPTPNETTDFANNLEDMLRELEKGQDGMMYFNEPMNDETRMILIENIKHTIELGKKFAKSGLPTSKQKIDELWKEFNERN